MIANRQLDGKDFSRRRFIHRHSEGLALTAVAYNKAYLEWREIVFPAMKRHVNFSRDYVYKKFYRLYHHFFPHNSSIHRCKTIFSPRSKLMLNILIE